MLTTVLVAPAGRHVGLTTACLGMVRALDRQGLRVSFVKPIANREPDHSASLVALGAHLYPHEPVPRQVAEGLLAAGDDQTLMEKVVETAGKAGQEADVLFIEGMNPEAGMVHASRVNALMLKALDAELVLVASPVHQSPTEIADSVAIAARGYGALAEGRSVGCVLNRVCHGVGVADTDTETFGPACGACGACVGAPVPPELDSALRAALKAENLRPLAIIPCNGSLSAPRVLDVAAAVGARILFPGESRIRRVKDVAVCAMTVPNALKAMKPSTLVITPGDRSDILLAAAMTVQAGTPLAGVILTGGLDPDPRVIALCRRAFEGGLPLLAVRDSSYRAAARLAAMNAEIPVDDPERVEETMNFVADHLDVAWAKGFAQATRVPRVSPPAFRHRLIEAARANPQRIVLPEGAEPRTVAAAAIVESRNIAHCVLLGNPNEVKEVAARQGVRLPDGVEILDPVTVAPKYVEPLVERRKAKGMTRERAEAELQDPIMIGTMMLALDHADGLVSGAIHTTAHTIRPALQIIKTVPGCNLVSSVFFMCLPDQVLVFGDCAVNPNPTAEQLADIAIQSAESAIAFGIPARVAMLSYSTGTSGTGEDVEKVKEATRLARLARPDLAIDGPLQYDAAVMPDVARLKAPGSLVAGQATVLVFPDLNTGNVTYKAVQRSANVVSMGPMLQGLAKPVNDLSRGCLIEDIVFTINLTAIQAQQTAGKLVTA
ncbi:MAG: phosphate acetyltransferase [Acidobacteria bacterium]|nr:phosphate acetyltransferase [Acidobacteriota bacterium]MCG3193532.1 Phosphate acetyltransferase [Thermoanaerobaculia bacterium]